MSNTKTIKGQLKVVRANNYGFFSVKVDDAWYSLGVKTDPNLVDNSIVEFEVEETVKGDKSYWNLKKGSTVKVVKESSAPTSSGGGSAPGVDWDLKDRKIILQSSRNAAINLVGVLADIGGLPITEKTTAAKKQEIVLAFVDKTTDEFFNAVVNIDAEEVDECAPPSDDMEGEE